VLLDFIVQYAEQEGLGEGRSPSALSGLSGGHSVDNSPQEASVILGRPDRLQSAILGRPDMIDMRSGGGGISDIDGAGAGGGYGAFA
jgi:hypothetical protein